MPVPDVYSAYRVALPITTATRGVPVTSTALSNVTCTPIHAPACQPSEANCTSGEPVSAALATTGGGNTLPSTLCAPAFVTACAPKPKPAAVEPSRASAIAPPFNPNALAPMLNPSVSASACTTTYRNTSVSVAVPLA